MKRIVQFFRLLKINLVLMRLTFTPVVVGPRYPVLQFFAYLNPWRHLGRKGRSRGESIRLALESLGPIFVKFGQLLSTRRDLVPDDIAAELEKLQDRVPPFSSQQARRIIENALQQKISVLFAEFNDQPLASASIAQVHAAVLPDGNQVVVKILRPNITKIIQHDIALLYLVARLTEKLWSQGKRLHPVALVAEFENTIVNELDLMREAANASQLRRNFLHSKTLYVPKIYWDYARTNVLVMERIHGIRISHIEALREKGCNFKKLAENGVEMFFTQVFRDNFFHADLHPGNLFVDATDPENPKFLVVDFGIMGSLSPTDQHYLAENLLAFLDRDFRRVAVLHVESGWVPPGTRIDQFEAAIRTVCEPILEKPLHDVSFGQLLLRLFTTAEQFNMELQPQLMLLQKTLLNIEGLGRQLYPQLDIWATAKPAMERWMREQRSVRRLAKMALHDFYDTAEKILKLPQTLHQTLQEFNHSQPIQLLQLLTHHQTQLSHTKKRYFFLGTSLLMALLAAFNLLTHQNWFTPPYWPWATAAVLLLIGWL